MLRTGKNRSNQVLTDLIYFAHSKCTWQEKHERTKHKTYTSTLPWFWTPWQIAYHHLQTASEALAMGLSLGLSAVQISHPVLWSILSTLVPGWGGYDKWTSKEMMGEKFQQQIHPWIWCFLCGLSLLSLAAVLTSGYTGKVTRLTSLKRHAYLLFLIFERFTFYLFVWVCAKSVSSHPQKLEEGARAPGTEVTWPHYLPYDVSGKHLSPKVWTYVTRLGSGPF